MCGRSPFYFSYIVSLPFGDRWQGWSCRLLDVLCLLKSELPQSLPGPLGGLCWAFPGPRQTTLIVADGRVCFSSLQAVGTSTAAHAPAKASKPFHLRPKSPQVMPIEEFQGKRKDWGPGDTSPPTSTGENKIQEGGPIPGSENPPRVAGSR